MAAHEARLPQAAAEVGAGRRGGARGRTFGSVFFLTLRRSPLGMTGAVILVIWLLSVVFPALVTSVPPLSQDLAHRLQPPSRTHPFGTDVLGRDVLARVLYGGRISITIGLVVISTTCAVGTTVGMLAGFWGGWVDELVMRVADVFLAFPPILLALAVAAALGPDLTNAAGALIVVWWPQYARMMRASTVEFMQAECVLSARAIGSRAPRILLRTILPNAITPVLVFAMLDTGSGIIAAATLSFLGLGVRPPTPEWGAMVAEGSTFLGRWWLAGFPGIAILSVVMAFNFIGDSIRDVLDPRLAHV
jgi:ABC-type dipeptide/oligopeptide/nickel transport system permease subunit